MHTFRFPRLSVKAVLAIFTGCVAVFLAPPSFAAAGPSTTIVISEIYGAGGNAGSPFTADYIEIFNLSATSQTLNGWSLQYASSTSTGTVSATNVFPLPATVTIPAGGYYLVSGQVTATSTGITDPADYATGSPTSTAGFTLSSASGRVYLVNSTTAVAEVGTDPSVIDFVGYGAAITSEGSNPAPLETNSSSTSNGTYDYRTNPCVDTNNNGADFSTATVQTSGTNAPHNSQSPLHPCVLTAPTATGKATPATQLQGLTTLLTVSVVPGTGTGIAVTANLSALGGSATQTFYDDGTHGDATSGDNTFSYTLTIPASQAATSYNISATVTDTQLDSIAPVTIPLTVLVQPPLTPIHTIQGTPPTTTSSYVGQMVNVTGIVTGVRGTGFYLQAKDSDADANLATPEGIYVNTVTAPPTATVAVGNNIQVAGTVTSPITATGYLASPLELDTPTGYYLVSTSNALPTPITLTATNFSATGLPTQLLAYQSMRMTAPSLTTVSGTSGTLAESTETYTSNGQFYSVLTGTARPFRAPGVDTRSTLPASAPAGTTRWTAPENVLQVDSLALGVAAIDLTTNAVLTPATGVLDYSAGTPLLMLSSVTAERPVITAGTAGTSASGASTSQVSIGQLNMQRFFNASGGGAVTLTANDYARRLRKASAAIRNSLAFPDVLAVQEVQNVTTLTNLATQVSSDATANSQTDPVYVAYVGTADSNGLANGFLVKSTKINVTGTPVTLATTTNYTDPGTGSQPIFDEPPFLLTASVKRGTGTPYPVDVVSAELLTAANINSTAVSGTSTLGASVRAKRKAQAEALAGGIQSTISGASTTPVVLACSCNAYEFSDGFVDVVGTLRGNPAAASTVVLADTAGIVTAGLTDTTTSLAAMDRYVTIESGFADALDHILYSSATPAGTTIAAAHIDADFNVTYRNDSSTAALTTPYRTSDHDALVATLQVPALSAYLTFNPSSLTLTFPAQPVNTTSASMPVVVTNTNTTTAILIASIVASPGFAQTNNCGASLAALASCTINVTFSPTSVGSPTGTVTLTDSDITGVQTITLSGTSYALLTDTTTLTAVPALPVATQAVTLTAAIVGNGTTVPTGTVTFKDGTNVLATGVAVTANGKSGTASYLVTAGFTAGAHSLTAVYSGDTVYATMTGPLSLNVAAVTSVTTVAATPTTSPVGSPVALTASVTSNLGVPGGTVQFYDGTTALGTAQALIAGSVTYNFSTLAVGTHNITATYSGSTGTPAYPVSTSATAVVVTIVVPDFSMLIGNSQLIVSGAGPSASTGIEITAINGLTVPVSFACSGLPAAATCSFSPSTLNPAGTFATGTLTITSTAAANHVPRFGLGTEGGTIALAFTLLMMPFAFRKRRAAIRMLALTIMLIAAAQTLSGCGGSTKRPITSSVVTVTGTAITGQVHSVTLTLVTE